MNNYPKVLSVWYPDHRKPGTGTNHPSKDIRKCPVCLGIGERKDAKTLVLRKCLACNGTGWINRIKHL